MQVYNDKRIKMETKKRLIDTDYLLSRGFTTLFVVSGVFTKSNNDGENEWHIDIVRHNDDRNIYDVNCIIKTEDGTVTTEMDFLNMTDADDLETRLLNMCGIDITKDEKKCT